MIHKLKIDNTFMWRILNNEKTAELRSHEDRDFQTGDEMWLTDPRDNVVKVNITHVLRGWGLKPNFSMLSFTITETPDKLPEMPS